MYLERLMNVTKSRDSTQWTVKCWRLLNHRTNDRSLCSWEKRSNCSIISFMFYCSTSVVHKCSNKSRNVRRSNQQTVYRLVELTNTCSLIFTLKCSPCLHQVRRQSLMCSYPNKSWQRSDSTYCLLVARKPQLVSLCIHILNLTLMYILL